MTYKWNALWVVSALVFVSFFISYQLAIEQDRDALRPEGIKIIYSKDLPVSEVQFYVDTTQIPHTIRFESVSDVDQRTDLGLIAVVLPYQGKLLDHTNWNHVQFDDEFVFVKEYGCTQKTPCTFTENNQFFRFALSESIDQKKSETHKVSLQFLDTAARSEIKRWITENHNPLALPLDNSFNLESSKVTVFIADVSDDIEPLPATPIRFSESGNRLLWDIESGILHQLRWEDPVERKQIFDMVFYSALYGIGLAIINLMIFAWSQRIENTGNQAIIQTEKTRHKVGISVLILIAVIVSVVFAIYLGNPIYLVQVIGQYIPDRDFDGIDDDSDFCPNIPENVNNFQDKDGCPDAEPYPKPNQNLTPVGEYKVSVLKDMAKSPQLIDALHSDNKKYSFMKKPFDYIHQKEIEWTEAGDTINPFMKSFGNNHVTDILNQNMKIRSETFGEIVFGEFILTNSFGANTAITTKTDNFDQAAEDWWNISKQHGLYIKSCEWDDSAEMHSEDIVIKIEHDGEFIGILNAATQCDVLQKES